MKTIYLKIIKKTSYNRNNYSKRRYITTLTCLSPNYPKTKYIQLQKQTHHLSRTTRNGRQNKGNSIVQAYAGWVGIQLWRHNLERNNCLAPSKVPSTGDSRCAPARQTAYTIHFWCSSHLRDDLLIDRRTDGEAALFSRVSCLDALAFWRRYVLSLHHTGNLSTERREAWQDIE